MYQPLIDHLANFKTIENEDITLLQKYFKPITFSKGDFLVKENIICNDILWISTGYFQVYIRNEIDEKTVHIAGNGDFISALSSFISREPSSENVQALTDVEALCIKYEDLQALYDHSKSWEHLGRKVMEDLFVRKHNRVISFIKHSAETRYENLLVNKPDFLRNIPLRILASYIGVKPETLSRIRAKIS